MCEKPQDIPVLRLFCKKNFPTFQLSSPFRILTTKSPDNFCKL